MNIYRLLSLLFLISLYQTGLYGAGDKIVAEVNGKKIYKSQLERSYHESLLVVTNKMVRRKTVLNDLINRELGIQRATKNNLHNNTIVKHKMDDVLYHAQVSKDLEGKFKGIKVTDADVKNYYKNNKEYRTAHILLRVRAKPEKAEVQAALDQSLKIYRMLKIKPHKFSEYANKYSQSSTSAGGGDLGFQAGIRLAPEYFKAIQGRQKNYISPPVRTQFGFHIINVLAIKDEKDINKPFYKKVVYDIKRDKIMEDYFRNLRKKAQVKVNKSLVNN